MPPTRSYHVSPDEIGPLARALRVAEGYLLKDAAELIGCDLSNLSKAERGHPSYTSLAARAVEVYARERARKQGLSARQVVRTEIRVPRIVSDAVDAVRAEERARRRGLIEGVFGEHGIATKSADRIDQVEASYGGQDYRVWLDRLMVTTARRPVRPPHLFALNQDAEDSSAEAEFYRRAAEWIKREGKSMT